MRLKTIAFLASLSLLAGPVSAQSNAVQRVAPTTVDRTDANVDAAEASNLGGGTNAIIGVLAAAVAASFIVLTVVNDDDDDNLPASP